MTQKTSHYYNMDLVRYILAISVLVNHFNVLSGSDFYWPIPSNIAVGVFFGLSGFLVYNSYLRRPDLKQYIKNRIKRIVPPYLFIILSCATGLALLSSLPSYDYFSSSSFWKYLGANICFLNFLQPTLPCVFDHLPISAVNGSLWTLKVEWMLYLSVPLFIWLIHKFHFNISFTIFIIIILSVIYRLFFEYLFEHTHQDIYRIMSYQFCGQMVYFFTGILFHHLLPLLKKHLLSVSLSCILIYALCFSMNLLMEYNMITDFISSLSMPVSLVSLALVVCIMPPLGNWVKYLNNYSYEIYLFHFPIIQVFISLREFQNTPPLQLLLLSLFVTIMIAYSENNLYNKLSFLVSSHFRS